MARSVDNHTVFTGALSAEIFLARIGKTPGVALDKRPATAEVVTAFTRHMMHSMPTGASMSVQVGDGYYRLSCIPMTKEDFDAERSAKAKP